MVDRERLSRTERGGGVMERGPKSELGEEFRHLLSVLAGRVLSGATDRVGGLTDRLANVGTAQGGGAGAKVIGTGRGAGAKVIGKGAGKGAGAGAGRVVGRVQRLSGGTSGVAGRVAAGAGGITGRAKGALGALGGLGGKRLKVVDVAKSVEAGAAVPAPRKAAKKSAAATTAAPRTASPRTAGTTAGPRTAGPRTAGPRAAAPRAAGPRTAAPVRGSSRGSGRPVRASGGRARRGGGGNG
jgi:hypothetical protein